MRFYAKLALLCILTACGNQSQNENEIRAQAKNYQEAFNRQDAKALSELWAQDARYVDPESGEVVSGRENIVRQFQAFFQAKEPLQIELTIKSIAFPKNDQAVELGTALVKQGNEELDQTAYRASYERQGGAWLLREVREVVFSNPPDQYEHLKDLGWLIGGWVDEDEDVTITNHFEWDKFKNFLTNKFSVNSEGQFALEGKQVIGWDPIKNEIRSWLFDSDGTFGEGVWKKSGDSWVVEMVQTLADGSRASATNIYTPVDGKSYKWESVNREIDGEILPNIGPINIKKG